MLERFTINLSTQERQALELIAKRDVRDIRAEARYLIRLELERRGLLSFQGSNMEHNELHMTNEKIA